MAIALHLNDGVLDSELGGSRRGTGKSELLKVNVHLARCAAKPLSRAPIKIVQTTSQLSARLRVLVQGAV
jgi:hypothetical protein